MRLRFSLSKNSEGLGVEMKCSPRSYPNASFMVCLCTLRVHVRSEYSRHIERAVQLRSGCITCNASSSRFDVPSVVPLRVGISLKLDVWHTVIIVPDHQHEIHFHVRALDSKKELLETENQRTCLLLVI